jgi:hypothetical protein
LDIAAFGAEDERLRLVADQVLQQNVLEVPTGVAYDVDDDATPGYPIDNAIWLDDKLAVGINSSCVELRYNSSE